MSRITFNATIHGSHEVGDIIVITKGRHVLKVEIIQLPKGYDLDGDIAKVQLVDLDFVKNHSQHKHSL